MLTRRTDIIDAVSVIPKGRDAQAKALYIFARRALRCERYDIDRRFKREFRNLMLYGTSHPELGMPEGVLKC